MKNRTSINTAFTIGCATEFDLLCDEFACKLLSHVRQKLAKEIESEECKHSGDMALQLAHTALKRVCDRINWRHENSDIGSDLVFLEVPKEES